MVTGSDSLDSYEALWSVLSCLTLILLLTHSFDRELAELLGQVKPPTATKEEIDKSGLQVMKASDLQRFEQEGKVSSNCVERVRIANPHE